MKKDILYGDAKMALIRSKVIFCAAVLGFVASFQIPIMSSPAHATAAFTNNNTIPCSTCHVKSGLANGTYKPFTATGSYYKTYRRLPVAQPQPPVYQPPRPQPPVYQPPRPQPPVYQPPVYTPPPTWRNPQPPVYQPPAASLAYPLQSELKRLGCLPGRVDGVWGRGSRAALRRFSRQARLRLGSEPSQNALNVARRTPSGYCPPVRPRYNPPRYNPPRVNNPPRYNQPRRRQSQPVTQACPHVRRLAGIIRNQGFGSVRWKDCDIQQRYTFFALQGGSRWRLRIRSNGIIYKQRRK